MRPETGCLAAMLALAACRSTAPGAKGTGEDASMATASPPAMPSVPASVGAAPSVPSGAPSPVSLDQTSPADYAEPTGPGYAVAMPSLESLLDSPGAAKEPVARWLSARVAKARAGERELVRVPVYQMGPCGCPCFFAFLGDHVDSMCASAGVPIQPRYEAPAVPIGNQIVGIAEGYFDGKVVTQETGTPEGAERLDELRVLRWRAPAPFVGKEGGAGDEAPPMSPADDRVVVLAVGDQAGLEAPAPADGRTHLVLESSTPLAGGEKAFRSARDRADALRARFPRVELVDSRRVPGLFCCNYVVVLDRFATQQEAAAAAAAGAKLGVKTSWRRGW
jgi:hypothetical protein